MSGTKSKTDQFSRIPWRKDDRWRTFWKITKGKDPMPSYEKELAVEERWHVINYINTFTKRP